MAQGWDPVAGQYPRQPVNVQVCSPYLPGMWDLRWDSPALAAQNSNWTIVGANIYRSQGSDRGPYIRVNEFPVGSTFYRDAHDNALVSNEVIPWDTGWTQRGTGPNTAEWTLRTQYSCVKQLGGGIFASSPDDVRVSIRLPDGTESRLAVAKVFGETGEITLLDEPFPRALNEDFDMLETLTAQSSVLVQYWRPANTVLTTSLDKKPYYRVTTVALDPTTPSGLRETPLDQCPPVSPIQVETRDYIWTEAIRRNNWILEQGGERVKVFIRKVSGIRCWCRLDPKTRVYLGQPRATCPACFGAGFVGGFDGPFEIIIAPDDGERRVSQGANGRRLEHTYEVWIGPTPVVTQRDFIVKQTNERYSIGAVKRPSARGNLLQQHFQIGYLDEGDIRYQVPVDGTAELGFPQTRYTRRTDVPYPVGPDVITPVITEKLEIDDGREQRGRTGTFENITY